MPFRPLKTETDYLGCIHWRTWPPLQALDFEGQTGLEIHQAGGINAVDLQRFQVWERVCGLLKMEESKCRTCPHIRLVEIKPPGVPMLVTMDGVTRTPIIDQTFAASLPSFRSHLMTAARPDGTIHSKREAAWIKQDREKSE